MKKISAIFRNKSIVKVLPDPAFLCLWKLILKMNFLLENAQNTKSYFIAYLPLESFQYREQQFCYHEAE